jgi:hypothetical protein
MPEAEIRKKLEALSISVQAEMQLRSKHRDQDTEKYRPLTPNFVVSVATRPDVVKCRLSPKSAACEFSWRRTWPQKGRFNANAASASGTRCVTAATHSGAWLSETRTRQVCVRPLSSSLNAAAAGTSTLPTTAVEVIGRRQRRPLQSARKESAAKMMASPHDCGQSNRPH